MANRNRTSVIVSALVGSIAAFVTCFVFFYFISKPARPGDAQNNYTLPKVPATTPSGEIPNPEIKVTDVTSVSINTIYKGYFDAGNKCSKTYDEYFGKNDGITSPSSPCTAQLTFNRDGHATRTVEIDRWDKAAREKKPVEKTESTADITSAQFNALAQTIVTNDAFRSWREGMMITVSNCSITVNYSGGSKGPMSNVDERTSVYLQMVDAFKQLEKQVSWKPA